MATTPERIFLTNQAEQVLAEGIAHGRWRSRLPAERELCRELLISRGTLRVALATLAKRRLIKLARSRPAEILPPLKRIAPSEADRSITCIGPIPLIQLSPFVVAWFDELRQQLQRVGLKLNYCHGPRYFSSHPDRALSQLTARHPQESWILVLSTRAMQEWFHRKRLPAIVAGSPYEGINLPSIDIDFHAVGRHAGGTMFARGHRRVAMLATSSGPEVFPGIRQLERGFLEAGEASRNAQREVLIQYSQAGAAAIAGAIDQLLRREHPPTALLIAQTSTLLTALSHLAQLRIVVPTDISAIVSHHESFYSDILPELTRYAWSHDQYSKQAIRLILELRRNPRITRAIRLMPRFVSGKSLAAIRLESGF